LFSTTRRNKKAPLKRKLAELEKSGRFRRPIVTQIEPAPTFYRAGRISSAVSREARTHALRDLTATVALVA
jgi:hypothetical protein